MTDPILEENNRLRAALAMSDQPCVYCMLPSTEWNKCQSGFPGCARADDAMGCPELGASLELKTVVQNIAAYVGQNLMSPKEYAEAILKGDWKPKAE